MTQKRKWSSEMMEGDVMLILNDWDNKEFLTDDEDHAIWLTEMLNNIEKFVGDDS